MATKKREAISLSEIARRHGVSRQSVRNWVLTDDFPAPILAAGTVFTAGRGKKVEDYKLIDPSGRAKHYDAQQVKDWIEQHPSLRTQHAPKAAPKAAAKPKADKPAAKTGKSKKAATKTVTKAKGKKSSGPKAPVKKSGSKKGKKAKA